MTKSRKAPILTIRQAILLVLLAVLVPAMAVEGLVYYKWYASRMSVELNTNLEVARAAAAAVNELILDIRREEEIVGKSLPMLQSMGRERLDQFVAMNVGEYGSIRSMSVADLQGIIIASSAPKGVGAAIAGEPYFEAIRSGAKEWVATDLVAQPGADELTFIVAIGIRDKGALRHVVTAAVDPAKAGDVLNMWRGSDGVSVVFDSKGVPVMSEPDIPLRLESFAPRDRLLREALAGREAFGDTVSLMDDQVHVGAKVPIAGLAWVAGASRSRHDTLVPVVRSFMTSLALIVLVVLASGAIALLVSHRIVRGVRGLHGYAVAAGTGDANTEVAVGGVVELAELGEAFSDTTRKRRQVEEDLRASEQRYRSFVEASAQVVWTTNPRGEVVLDIPAWQAFTGQTAEQARGFGWMDAIRPEDRQRVADAWRKAIESRGLYEVEYRLRRHDGTWRDVLARGVPVLETDGSIREYVGTCIDITQRKLAEEELRRTVERLQEQLQITDLAHVLVRDVEGRITHWNAGAERLYGWTRKEAVGRFSHTLLKTVFPQPLEQIEAAVLREGHWEGELVHIRRDGAQITVASHWVVHRDPQGRPIAILEVNNDITDRKRAEEALRESEATLRGILNAAKESIWLFSPDGIMLMGNQMALVRFGRPAAEVIGKHFTDILPAGLAQSRLTRLKQAVESGRPLEFEDERSGILFHHSFYPVADADGRVTCVACFSRDITERRRAELQLRETRDYLENLFDYANAPIIVWDRGFRITRFNHAFERLTGLTADKVIGEPLDILFPADRRSEAMDHIRRTQSGERWEVVEIPIRHVDGTVRTVLWNSATLFGDDGKTPVATIAQGQDISDRKEVERQLRETRDYLENLFNYANAPIIVWDPGFRITRFNHAFERLTGRTASDVLGKPLDILLPAEEREEALAHIWHAAAGERWEVVEIPILHVDGTVRTVLWNSATLYAADGKTVVATIAQGQDITERVQAEERLRKLSQAVEQSPATVVITDTEGSIEYVNPQFTRSTGYTFEEALGKNPRVLKTEYTPPDTFKQMWETIKGGRDWHGEFCNRRKNGELYWESASISPVTDGDGQTTHFVAVKIDITDRKRAEEQLRETRDYLENLFDYANAPIIVWDPEFRITRFNHAFERLTGRSVKEVLGRSLDILFPADRRDEAMSHIHRAVAGERWEVVEIPILRADGAVRTVLWNSATLYANDGKTVVATIAQGQDITERKEAEEALRHSNQRQELLAATAGELLKSDVPQEVVEGLCRRVLAVLDCQVFFNYLVDEGAGRLRLNACAGIPEETAKSIEWLEFGAAVCGCVARDGCRIVAEDIQHSSDPRADLVRSFGIQAYACHPLLSRGQVIGTLSFGATTRASFAADELALMKAVADHVAIAMERMRGVETLRRTAADLARSNRDLEQFAYVASHDLQEPLRTVAGYLQLIERRYKAKLDKEADEFIAFAVDGALRLKQLINDLLAYSRVGTRGHAFEPTNCNDVLETVLEGLGGMIRENHATVTHDTLPTVPCDPVQVAQLFQNLITNAIKFRRDELPQIHVSAERVGGVWRFSVRDNGIGIERQYFDRVFVVFQRLHTRERYPGTGIGLAICKRIVDRHGGRIWVESEAGKGSTFYFTLTGGAA